MDMNVYRIIYEVLFLGMLYLEIVNIFYYVIFDKCLNKRILIFYIYYF